MQPHAVLFQLPVPNNPQANVPLAAGYLVAYAAAQGLLDDWQLTILPRAVTDAAGDAALVAAVLAAQPTLLGVSLYTWNSERSLHLLGLIKAQRPEIVVIVGGPEVQRDNRWVLEHPAVDVAVLGEGEQTFAELLGCFAAPAAQLAADALPLVGPSPLHSVAGIAFKAAGELVITPPRAGLADLSVVPSPFLAGYLPLRPGDTAFIECSRWCPYRCTFCLYGRNMGSKLGSRLFPAERVAAEVAWAQQQGVTTIHFVEANLNLLPYFRPLMAALAQLNPAGALRFYAELRGEHLGDAAVAALVDAGLYAAEVGLQSANPAALAAVERRTDLAKWAAGTRRLYDHGIEVLLDVILGLPGDDVAGVEYTLQWLREERLGPYDVFVLQVLPGTVVRERAAEHRLVFQDRPPYYILANNELDWPTLRALRWELKEQAGFDPAAVEGMPEIVLDAAGLAAPAAPLAVVGRSEGAGGWITALAAHCAAGADWPALGAALAAELAAHVTLYLHGWDAAALHAVVAPLARANPTIYWDVVCMAAPPPAELRALHDSWPHSIGYLDRVAVFRQREPAPAYAQVTPRWTVLAPWGVALDPLRYEGLAAVVWLVTAEQLAANLASIERHGGAGLAIAGAGATPQLRERIAEWQTASGWPVWWL